MTTILGIKTNSGEDAIILCADNQISYEEGGKFTRKADDCTKIRIGKNYALAFSGNYNSKLLEGFFEYISGEKPFDKYIKLLTGKLKPRESGSLFYALAFNSSDLKKKIDDLKDPDKLSDLERQVALLMSEEHEPKGDFDKVLKRMFQKIREGNPPVDEAIASGTFFEFYLLNKEDCKAQDNVFYESASELILVSNKPNLEIYRVDSFGNLIESKDNAGLDYICLGSGAKLVNDYFDKEEYNKNGDSKISLHNITIPNALTLMSGAMKVASQDPHTSEYYDTAIVLKDRILFEADELKNTARKAVKDKLFEIAQKFKK